MENAERSIAANPESYPLHVSLLADVTAVMVQQARSALGRTDELLEEALRSNPDRTDEEIAQLAATLREPLIDRPQEHGAIFGAAAAAKAGVPVIHADSRSDQWRIIWRLWAKYFHLDAYVCEGALASQGTPRGPYSA